MQVIADRMLARKFHIKICGLRQLDHAMVAAESGASMIGLMFAPSRRQITPADAQTLARELRTEFGDKTPLITGIFLDASPERINEIADMVSLDLVQLHGTLPASELRKIHRPVVPVINPKPGSDVPSVVAGIRDSNEDSYRPLVWLVDAWDPVQHGGTGKRADWQLAQALARETRILLAGGLNAANVADAILFVKPWGIDVSSGVESEGVKDLRKIRTFIAAAQSAFASIY